jgi:ADP-ribosylglycohydrolase
MSNLPTKEQFEGCLIGQCVGDALGFVVEGQPSEVCREYVEEALDKGHPGDHRRRGRYAFGQYSDDSQLARELMQSYAARERFDPEDYARRIAAIFSEDRIVGRGRATEQAAVRLNQGVPWQEAGTPPPSAGNGSAMRAGPVGLLFFDDLTLLAQAAHDQGVITHRDARCSAGAVVIAGAVALALRTEPIDLSEFTSHLGELVGEIDPSFASGIRQLPGWMPLFPEEAVELISRVGLEPGYSDGWRGISPFVVSSVLWSLYSFLKSPEDYRETVRIAIAVGGDVDTTAAMAGAISAAHLGLGAVPSNLAERLTDQGSWGLGELKGLASDCYDLKMQQLDSS